MDGATTGNAGGMDDPVEAVGHGTENGFDRGFLGPGAEMGGVGRVLYPKLDPGEALVQCLVVWGMGILAALWPARTAAKTQPIVAMAQL